jgi:hypothetical protein
METLTSIAACGFAAFAGTWLAAWWLSRREK